MTDRQAQTVTRLLDAAADELAEVGYPSLAIRDVAARAGVAPATAYTYFASKEHLVAEMFWRRIAMQPPTKVDRRRSPTARATDVLLEFSLAVVGETELAAACTLGLLADDPEVREMRARMGATLHERLAAALGSEVNASTITALELLTTGVLLQAGTGHIPYSQVPSVLAEMAGVVLDGWDIAASRSRSGGRG
jgi:AcrR family transcriptional regulator